MWSLAQGQLSDLRKAVERSAQLAQAQVASTRLKSERDRALRDLGEGIWRLVLAGKAKLPPSMAELQRKLEGLDEKARLQSGAIDELLKEGAEAAERVARARPEGSPPGGRSPGGRPPAPPRRGRSK